VQRPTAVTGDDVVVVDDGALLVAVVPEESLGDGAPVANRQPAPGGLKAVMLIFGAGRFVSGFVGCVLGVVGIVLGVVEPVLFVVGDVTCRVVGGVVGVAAGEWCPSFSWNPTMTSAVTQSPRTTRRVQPGRAPSRVDVVGINFECNSGRRNYNNKRQ
jgi:hypothetical protein